MVLSSLFESIERAGSEEEEEEAEEKGTFHTLVLYPRPQPAPLQPILPDTRSVSVLFEKVPVSFPPSLLSQQSSVIDTILE